MVKQAPLSFSPSTVTNPLWRSTISFTTDRPMPRPPLSRVRPASARQKRLNTIFASSGVRPMPVSRTAMAALSPWLETLTVMVPPSGV